MHKNFKIVAVTPAGRRRYVEILLKYILRDRNIIDEWHLWLNTTEKSDIEYCKSLEKEHSFIKTIPLSGRFDGNLSIHHFFKDCVDSDTIYIRFDDDICWIEAGAIEKLLDFRIANPEYFLVFPNIINNAIISHIHQRFGLISKLHGICKYDVTDNVGWRCPRTATEVHTNFLKAIEGKIDIAKYKFPQWELYFHERFSINCFAFFGDTFNEFSGEVGEKEENWLTTDKPKMDNITNCIYGESLVVHFAFGVQRKPLENKTNFLAKYKELADQITIAPQNESTSHEQQTNDQSS